MDKNKIIEAAAKLVAKGAYDKAIKEYQKVLEADPKDVRILQKMGELYQKKNDNPQAAQYFIKVAESYSADGFFLKAVALYKQVLKLDPSLMDINIKLAELHQQLQLMGEAMAYYQIVANHYDKSGDPKRSLEVLRKMVDLEPDNVASRVKLADLYVREGMQDDAKTEFEKAAEHLKRNNRVDDYLRVAERLAGLDANNLTLARELAELYLQRNDQKRALAKLQVCFKANPRDIDTLRLLAVAFQGLGQTSKTLSVYKELARAYEDAGNAADAEQTWQQVARLDPNDGDVAARRPQAAAAVPQPEPEPAAYPDEAPPEPRGGAQTTLASAHQAPSATAAKPKGESIGKLLTETDVYVKYGLHDKALEHLRKVFSVEPENIDAHEKAYHIYVASNNHAQAFEQLLNVLRLHARSGDSGRAQQYLKVMLEQNPGHPEVPAFLATLQAGGGADAPVTSSAQEVPEDAILVDSSDDAVIVADEPQDEVISADVALSAEQQMDDGYAEEDPALAAAAADYTLEPPVADEAGTGDAEVVSDFPPGAALGDDAPDASTGEHRALQIPEDDFSDQDNGLPLNAPPTRFDSAPMASLGDEHDMPTRVTNRLDPALLKTVSGNKSPVGRPSTGAALTSKRPAFEPPDEAPPQRFSVEEPAEEPDSPQPVPEESFADAGGDDPVAQEPVAEDAVEAPPDEEPASEECDEATFFVEQGLFEEAREILETVLIAYPDHRRASALLAQVEAGGAAPADAHAAGGNGTDGAEEPTGAGRDAFDLAAELADELGDFGAGSAPEPTGGGDDYQVSVEEVFSEFKKGLEKVVKPEDVDTHYDLGIAYKEMGLLDDAIGEFTIARKGCVGKRKEVDCLTMSGLLQVMKGDFAAAVDAFQLGLASEHSKGDTEKAMRFELGVAYEAAGQNGKALGQFMKVQAADPGYRDVGQAVERLSAVATPEDDGPPPPPKGPRGPAGGRKVGYV